MPKEKISRGNSSRFFVAGELCRRGHAAVVTLGNCPNTDILCSNTRGTRFVHIQVKTFVPGNIACSVGLKAERDFGENFFWVLAGIPLAEQNAEFEYYIIPSGEIAKHVCEAHQLWLNTPGKNGQAHRDSAVRTVHLPPRTSFSRWDISEYRDRWDLVEERLRA
jgi:hypothetical protein